MERYNRCSIVATKGKRRYEFKSQTEAVKKIKVAQPAISRALAYGEPTKNGWKITKF